MRVAVGETVTVVAAPSADVITSADVVVVALDGTVLPAPSVDIHGRVASFSLGDEATDHLDRLTVTVTAVLDDDTIEVQQVVVEVVGAHWLTVSQLRAEQGLDDEARFPATLVADVRDEWADHLDRLCNRAFVPRLIRERHPGGPIVVHHSDPRRIISVDGDDVDIIVDSDGVTGLTGPATLLVEVGSDAPPPMLVREARKAIGRELLMRSAVSPNDRISETFGEGGTIRYSTPDPRAGRWTGMLSLDPVIAAHQAARAGFA